MADLGHEWHVERPVHTFEFHKDRERAPHLEQDEHKGRLLKVAEIITQLTETHGVRHVSDLGCGDGGLLSLLKERDIYCWGYDFQPSNVPAWAERGVSAEQLDVFNHPDRFIHPDVLLGDVVVLTEVLEHVRYPHGVLEALHNRTDHPMYVVASSPRFETAEHLGDCHQWAWDWDGYAAMFDHREWTPLQHVAVDWSQVLLASW